MARKPSTYDDAEKKKITVHVGQTIIFVGRLTGQYCLHYIEALARLRIGTTQAGKLNSFRFIMCKFN